MQIIETNVNHYVFGCALYIKLLRINRIYRKQRDIVNQKIMFIP